MSLVKKKSRTPLWPPVTVPDNENDEERRARISQEAEAKRISDRIDHQLEAERQQKKKASGPKILLLGQAESGKSTVLKNFQLHFAPKAFEREAEAWRPVVHLNLVRSVNFIVNFVQSRNPSLQDSYSSHQRKLSAGSVAVNQELRRLCVRLAPLRQVEQNLSDTLSGRSSANSSNNTDISTQSYNPAKAPEISIRSGSSWKQAFSIRSSADSASTHSTDSDGQSRRILAALGEDIAALWNDPTVQKCLKASEIALQEQPGFFLDQSARITREDYRPRPDDVLKARVTTMGPEEHTIFAEQGIEKSRPWKIYDVGGSRNQRAAWAQYFDDVNAIIFLAPMSGFNQVLAEDESVNRLSDSIRLWQMLCTNKILAGVQFVLFLNKLDILDAKLKSGVQFSSFVTSYTGTANETKPVSRYLLDVFVSLHQQLSPKSRRVHPYLTCAVDTKATSSVIGRIQEVIVMKALGNTTII